MLAFLRTWLIGIVAVSLVLSIVLTVLPEGVIRTIARTTGSLILLLALLGPVVNADLTSLTAVNEGKENAVAEQVEAFAAENREQLQKQVAQKTEAVIEAEAERLGIDCRAAVTTVQRDGACFPDTVALSAPEDPRLEEYLSAELGIDRAHQRWEADE